MERTSSRGDRFDLTPKEPYQPAMFSSQTNSLKRNERGGGGSKRPLTVVRGEGSCRQEREIPEKPKIREPQTPPGAGGINWGGRLPSTSGDLSSQLTVAWDRSLQEGFRNQILGARRPDSPKGIRLTRGKPELTGGRPGCQPRGKK